MLPLRGSWRGRVTAHSTMISLDRRAACREGPHPSVVVGRVDGAALERVAVGPHAVAQALTGQAGLGK